MVSRPPSISLKTSRPASVFDTLEAYTPWKARITLKMVFSARCFCYGPFLTWGQLRIEAVICAVWLLSSSIASWKLFHMMTAELWIQCYVHLAQHDHVCLLLLCQLCQDLAHMDWLERDQHWPRDHKTSVRYWAPLPSECYKQTNNSAKVPSKLWFSPVLCKSITAFQQNVSHSLRHQPC